jgi:DNA-binding IclR family transcriptional regulator
MSKALARAFGVLESLAGHASEGRRLGDIAKAVGSIPSTALRDLQELEQVGMVQRIPGREDCWRMTPRIVRFAVATQHELARLRQRLEDIEASYLGARRSH